jgi:hypothetical protein
MRELRDQLLANQDKALSRLRETPLTSTPLGDFTLPGQLSSSFKCWADRTSTELKPYRAVAYTCSTEDEIYISKDYSAGEISFRHDLISSEKLNRFQFYTLYEDWFKGRKKEGPYGDEQNVTNFECASELVESNGIPFKAFLCLRAYKKLPGLYDMFFRAASLHDAHSGLMTSLKLTGVSAENAQAFVGEYMEGISWRK